MDVEDLNTNSVGETIVQNRSNVIALPGGHCDREDPRGSLGYQKPEIVASRPSLPWSNHVLKKVYRSPTVSPLMQWWLDEKRKLGIFFAI